MFKFVTAFVFIASALAQEDPYEVCQGVEDNTLIGIGQDISCTAYFFCENDYGYEEDCAELYGDEFQFNYETGQCDYDDVVFCELDEPVDPLPEETDPPAIETTTTLTATTSDSSIADIECPTNRPGEILFFPSSNCSEYFICANGVRMRMVCMEGFTWNAADNQCDYPIFSRCSVSFRVSIRSKVSNYLKSRLISPTTA